MTPEDQGAAQQRAGEEQPPGTVAAVPSDYPSGDCIFTAEWGTISAHVRGDGEEAILLAVIPALPDEVVDAERITALLQANRIVYGLLPEKIAQIAALVDGIAGWTGRMVVAEGEPPGIPGGLAYTLFGPDAEVTLSGTDSVDVNGRSLYFGPVQNFFQQNRGPGEDPEFVVKAISAGEIVASRQDPLEGRLGRDIFNRPLKAPKFCSLLAGENINIVEMRQFVAALFGYMVVLNRRLSILSPIIVADDDMTAWYVNIPHQFPPLRHPSSTEICQALNAAGVSRGFLHDDIAALCTALEQGSAPVWNVVARGMLAEPGEDGRLEFSWEGQDVAGKIREDGSMDMRELNLVHTVEGGDLVAVLYPPTAGQPGYTLRGLDLETTPGQELKVEAQDHVRIEDGEGLSIRFYAEEPGLVIFQNQKITIEPLYVVKGNVDFSTGNIDVDCNLQINGSICSDFIVKSTKNVLVAGAVEPGAKLLVGGDLDIKGGILGETTEVTVLGNLKAEYIQAAKVVVKGEIHIRQYIFVSHVRSVGAIQVGPGRGARGGSIAGGNVCSSATITAKSCGSPSNVPTILALKPQPQQLAELKELKRAIKECHGRLKLIKSTLKVESFDLKELQAHCPVGAEDGAKAVYCKLLVDIKNNLRKLQELNGAKDILEEKMRGDVALMSISISQHSYGNTLVRIWEKEFLDKNDRGPTTYSLKDGSVVADSKGGAGGPGEKSDV